MEDRRYYYDEEDEEQQSLNRQRLRSIRDILIGFVAGFGFFMGIVAVDEQLHSLRLSDERMPLPMNNSGAVIPPSESTTTTNTHRRLESSSSPQRDFLKIGQGTGTDKVWGGNRFQPCLDHPERCSHKDMVNPKCRILQGHFYHTMYQKWLGPYSTDDAEPFMFLEIGHFEGSGYVAYKEFLPRGETHSMEIACLPHGDLKEGKWPWPNFPSKNPRYQEFLDSGELHCGDASKWEFLHETWTTKMNRPDAPPLKVVVEDAAHLSHHMAASLFFWFPRIAPGGILVMEDIQPINEANQFRTHLLPQVMKDLHFCGGPQSVKDRACFPTIWPLLQSVHCELHICVFERNQEPSVEYGREESLPPPHALNAGSCLFEHDK